MLRRQQRTVDLVRARHRAGLARGAERRLRASAGERRAAAGWARLAAPNGNLHAAPASQFVAGRAGPAVARADLRAADRLPAQADLVRVAAGVAARVAAATTATARGAATAGGAARCSSRAARSSVVGGARAAARAEQRSNGDE